MDTKALSVKIVDVNKNFIEPVTITDDFATQVCFHHAEIEKVVPTKKGQDKSVKVVERAPIIVVWDGEQFSFGLCEPGQEMQIKGHTYIIDREVDETPLMMSSDFVSQLLDPDGKKMIKRFHPKELLIEVENYLREYFYLPSPMLYKVVALFAVNMHVFDAHGSTPYLYIRSPDKGCGKSHLGQSLIEMTNGIMATNMKAHHIFRAVHGSKTVLGFDEIKGWSGGRAKDRETEDILSLINTGFQKGGGKAPRMIDLGGGRYKTEWFDSYSPKIFITTYSNIPQDTQSRCIEIIMQRARADDVDYGDKWFEPERKEKLKRIREMGILFRFKCGMELHKISGQSDWRRVLDTTDTFLGIKNRELEIFRPLVIMCLKYIPEWKDELAKYIRKYTDMRNKLEPTDTNAILFALRSIYREVMHGWYSVSDEALHVELGKDDVFGDVMYVPVRAVVEKILATTDAIDLGRNPNSRVGLKLKDLGFTNAIRRKFGVVRVIKISDLREQVHNYLNMPLSKDNLEDERPELSQAERIELIRDALLKKPEGMTYDELYTELEKKMSQENFDSAIKSLRTNGYIMEMGKVIVWVLTE